MASVAQHEEAFLHVTHIHPLPPSLDVHYEVGNVLGEKILHENCNAETQLVEEI